MKSKLHSLFIALTMSASVDQAIAQLPVISSFSQNGVLVCTNLNPGSVAVVAWASSPTGPWQTNWPGLDAVTADSNGMIQVSVPMFYRVLGVAATNAYPTYTTAGMALIPAGPFTIGDTLDGDSNATPRNVYVSGFYMDKNLVSLNQWAAVYAYATANGYGFDHLGAGKGANYPVNSVSWFDCVIWCNARSQQAGLTPVYYKDAEFTQVYTNGVAVPYANWTAGGYRLPTEAEWEKAARGGLINKRFPWGNTISESQANYNANPSDYFYDLGPYTGFNTSYYTTPYPYTSPVGTFAANGYGLHDMAGNLSEWCWDWYAGNPFPTGSPYLGGTDPRGPASSPIDTRVVRGGNWNVNASFARCADRDLYNEFPFYGNIYFGFRCVRGL